MAVIAPQGYSVLLTENAQTHELTSVAVARNTDAIFSVSRSGQTGGPFPNSFSFAPQTGPDAGNWLMDSNADGIFDFKFVDPQTSSTKYLRWEEGKGWVECFKEDVPEEVNRSSSR
jgi:hypothetical protein